MAHSIGPLSQIPQGEGRNFVIDGTPVAVFHTRAGDVFATQAACPHLGGPLADGLTENHAVVCPLHDRMFDFRTGAGIGTECSISVYPARLDGDGMVLVGPLK